MLTVNYISYPASGQRYIEGVCLSSDTKPTTDNSIYNGSKLLEMDTATLYIYDAKNKTWRAWE